MAAIPGTPIESAEDANGRSIFKGDTVATMGDNISARVGALCEDMGMQFIRLKPLHQPYGKGVWHAADRVIRLSGPSRNKDKDQAKDKSHKKVAGVNGRDNGEKTS